MSYLVSRGCSTAAGVGVSALMRTLDDGRAHLRDGAFRFEKSEWPIRRRLGEEIFRAVQEVRNSAPLPSWERFRRGHSGLILASTKGCGFDSLGSGDGIDPLTPLLQDLEVRLEFRAERSLCISNACSSGLAALRLAQLWLKQGLEDVLIVGADAVTPFVEKGFSSLKLLARSPTRADGTEGFLLGEAAACVWLSRHPAEIFLRQVGMDSEPSLVTRPESSSASLKRAILQIPQIRSAGPDAIFHHGTGTAANAATEDRVLNEIFPAIPRSGTKHLIGHTLGASALVDMIVAMERLRAGRNQRILLTSLGFGGMQAAALVEVQ